MGLIGVSRIIIFDLVVRVGYLTEDLGAMLLCCLCASLRLAMLSSQWKSFRLHPCLCHR